MSRVNKVKIEQADGGGKSHTALKKQKARHERRKAKKDPECTAHYRKFRGYQL